MAVYFSVNERKAFESPSHAILFEIMYIAAVFISIVLLKIK